MEGGGEEDSVLVCYFDDVVRLLTARPFRGGGVAKGGFAFPHGHHSGCRHHYRYRYRYRSVVVAGTFRVIFTFAVTTTVIPVTVPVNVTGDFCFGHPLVVVVVAVQAVGVASAISTVIVAVNFYVTVFPAVTVIVISVMTCTIAGAFLSSPARFTRRRRRVPSSSCRYRYHHRYRWGHFFRCRFCV